MARVTCRCGEPLDVPVDGPERVVCPKCSARVRIIRKRTTAPPPVPDADGYLRFLCPCGRRLKLDASSGAATHGRCPDCGRVISTAEARTMPSAGDGETPTEDLSAEDVARVEAWARGHLQRSSAPPPVAEARPQSTAEMTPEMTARRGEAGLRVCPQCGKPVHLGTSACRTCGIALPKR